ncbi:hypothetical protein HYPSUDRAFT_58602 [Hypholoma sublateritium FD-334 SS-4]|uniref:non-specific serine/threonine protein kinase n=1 Tax=Hypholoma sublateritium (strain FD-334 SS-4) TaxID=945553 RepID=A0A0D2KMJ5_HYPSF|nr:hypothetical protein HYPSUDRAFT_58602 [Hypholoma sublateritium FD-334 SS-4]
MKGLSAFSRALQTFRRSPQEIFKFPEEPLSLSVGEKGGFYAATSSLTSTLNSRYTLVGKLGWGIHSSVWLARDMSRVKAHPGSKYVTTLIVMDLIFASSSRLWVLSMALSTILVEVYLLSSSRMPDSSYSLDDLQNLNHTKSNYEIQLTDFGTATMVDGPHADIIQPYALRAPEVILGNGWNTSADIWNLGCLLFEFLTGRWLFSPRSGPTWSAESYHLAHMPVISGEEFNLTYVRKGRYFEKYFTPEGRLSIQVQNIRNLEEALDSYHVLDDVDKPLCVDFLRSMLRLKPSDRATAAELLEHAWIKS